MEVYTGDSDSPTKHQKHYRNSGVAIGAIISGPLLVAEPGSPKKKCKVNDVTNSNPEQNNDDCTGDSDSPTKHQKHYRNSGVAIGAIISGPLLVAEPSSPKKKCKVNDMTNSNPEQNNDDCQDSSIISND